MKRKTTPPHISQYNGVVERALRLLRDKTVALLRGMIADKSDRLWAETMNYACEMSNRCTTTSLNSGSDNFRYFSRTVMHSGSYLSGVGAA